MSYLSLLFVVFLTGMLLAGDCFIKAATTKTNPLNFLIIAAILWVSSIYGWYWIAKTERLAIVGALFSVLSLVGIVLLGISIFHETMSTKEWVGVGLGVVATLLLSGKL